MNYYYVIASLPRLSIGEPLPKVNINETLHFIRRNLISSDLEMSKYLFYPNDNQNLISLILEKFHNITPIEFRSPSIYTNEELEEFLKSGHDLPVYMKKYRGAHKENFKLLSPELVEENLWIEFYNEVRTLENEFIIEYFKFDKLLRQIAAFHNSEMLEDPMSTKLVNDVIIKDLNLNKPTSSLSKTYPFMDEIINALDSHDPRSIEQSMDMVRWRFIDSYELPGSFSNNRLFGWLVKFILYTRWAGLSVDKSSARFEEICEEALSASGISELEEL